MIKKNNVRTVTKSVFECPHEMVWQKKPITFLAVNLGSIKLSKKRCQFNVIMIFSNPYQTSLYLYAL